MQEQRLTTRLTRYWEMLRKDAELPHFAQFNQGAVSDLWPKCMLMALQPTAAGKPGFRVQRVGEQLTAILGNDMEGRDVSKPAFHAFGGGKIAEQVQEVAQARVPVEMEGKYVTDKNKIVKYRACLLPFSSDSENVSHIIAGLSWREF